MSDQQMHVMEQRADDSEAQVPSNEPATVTAALESRGICPYCDEPLDGEIVNGLHLDCDRELYQEMEQVWPEGQIVHIVE